MRRFLFPLLLIYPLTIFSQTIIWQEVTSSYSLPSGVKIFKGSRTSPVLTISYIDVDLNVSTVAVRPYIGTSTALPAFNTAVGAYASINGGFFGGDVPYSAVVYPSEVKATNVQTVTRNSMAYPVIRGFFGMKADRSLSVDWIYQFGSSLKDMYTYAQPLAYIANDPTPKAAPTISNGTQYSNLLVGIGGGPVLIKNGTMSITYNQELMWGSGVGETNGDPRTGIGYTANKHVIMMTADGRQTTISDGVSLAELAQIMNDLGCVEALNLDGGGSTQMAAGNQYVNSPSEQRAVPAIFSVVHTDSLNLPKTPLFQKIIDTGDSNATAIGTGWFESANSGFWGTTKSQLHPIGTGITSYEFRLWLPRVARYSVYGWWVSSSNRCSDTPFIIRHKNGADTVRVDQTINGSMWKLLGTYDFTGTAADRVAVSDAATKGTYVVADAVKLESYDSVFATSVEKKIVARANGSFDLQQNYPNPFNPATTISFSIVQQTPVSLKVFNALGEQVEDLLHEVKSPGNYHLIFSAHNLPSGVYFCQLRTQSGVTTKRMVLIK